MTKQARSGSLIRTPSPVSLVDSVSSYMTGELRATPHNDHSTVLPLYPRHDHSPGSARSWDTLPRSRTSQSAAGRQLFYRDAQILHRSAIDGPLSRDPYGYFIPSSVRALPYKDKQQYNEMKWNERGFRPPLCTYRQIWARRTSWGWWDEWDDTALQTQDSKFKPWRSEAEHATSRPRRLLTILSFTSGWGRNIFRRRPRLRADSNTRFGNRIDLHIVWLQLFSEPETLGYMIKV